ncbi:GNAT family N-acetyltransferase [Methanogenium sp. S4BF]|uniref:GNAT family N-acetyltransferase n=1 Tax=Methanogenium sp. S4BF TaxID=1789226 RepID=UPI002415E4B4|nr:GNAT family N-acetyltransferase [Methanogenium sp. S4BF]WFN33515.1 GNAT family N-acetyltransferase [Methanogenium sp. S4BF]
MKSEQTSTIEPEKDRSVYTSKIRLELLKAVTERGKLFRFRAPGFSMYPFIRNGDIITVAPLPENGPETGDVVAFVHPGTGNLIVHRVVEKTDRGYLIRGDNTEGPDGTIPASSLIGVVVRVEHKERDAAVAGIRYGRRPIAMLSRTGHLRKITRTISHFKGAGAAGLQTAQKFALYRRVAGSLKPRISIAEADDQDMNNFYSGWNYHPDQPPYRPDPLVTNFVAKDGKEIVGFVQLMRHPESHHPYAGYWLIDLMVRVPYRGMGIGRDLSEQVILMAEQEGAPELSLIVGETNRPAISLYRKLGFEPLTQPELEQQISDEYASTGIRRIAMHRICERRT